MSKKLSKAEIITIIEGYLTHKLSFTEPELAEYSLNKYRRITAKLRTAQKQLGYNFDFIIEGINALGNAEAIGDMDINSQLILKTSAKHKNKHRRKHEKTKLINSAEGLDTLDETDIGE